MSINEVINQVMDLKPQEKYLIIEQLVQSLNEPDKEIEKMWVEESKKRLEAYERGELKTISFDEVFGK